MNVSGFCDDVSLENFHRLSPRERAELTRHAQDIVDKKTPGHVRLAKKILRFGTQSALTDEDTAYHTTRAWRSLSATLYKGYASAALLPNVLLFRGSARPFGEFVKNRAAYFALEPRIAAVYVNMGIVKKAGQHVGHLGVFATRSKIPLFRLDSVENVNRLLQDFFLTDKGMYAVVKKMFMRAQHQARMTLYDVTKFYDYVTVSETPARPVQFRRLVRASTLVNDVKFVRWLCDHGFRGYVADKLALHPEVSAKDLSEVEFGAEVVFCDPGKEVLYLDDVRIRAPTSFQQLNDVLIEIQKKPAITAFMKKHHYL